jgi:hypothetical protein
MYFQSGWDRYKRSMCLEGQQAIDQLWACASDKLAKSVYDSGMQGPYTEPALMAAMEKLAVRALVPWEWIEEHYGSSAFNLLLMTDLPPLQLHADPRATPVTVHQPVSIP